MHFNRVYFSFNHFYMTLWTLFIPKTEVIKKVKDEDKDVSALN